jgi:hypothetical protein
VLMLKALYVNIERVEISPLASSARVIAFIHARLIV